MIDRKILKELPTTTGVYLFLEKKRPLYIGKAKNIQKRVSGHLQQPWNERQKAYLERSDTLDFIITEDEKSALFLENVLIKKHMPPYNVMLRDDKTYPYLVLTLSDPYPRIGFTRRVTPGKDRYFGPFDSAAAARGMVKFIARHFQIRACTLDLSKPLKKPCLYYHMGSCLGPCVEGLTNVREYGERVNEALLFLDGKDRELAGVLKSKVERYAKKQAYEQAGAYRDLYRMVSRRRERKKVADAASGSVDLFAHHRDRDNIAVVVLVFRKGLLTEKREYFWEGEGWSEDFYDEMVPGFYVINPWIPARVFLDSPPAEPETLAEGLRALRGAAVRVNVPERGLWKDRVEMAKENARSAFQRRFRGFISRDPGLEELEETLNLHGIRRIEAFDISHFRGRDRYGGMIVYDRGSFSKKDYRTYRLTGSAGEDDVAGMKEMVGRRCRRVREENLSAPDLILIDGGPTQVAAAYQAVKEESLGVPVVGLAKKEEVIHFSDGRLPLDLPRDHRGLTLLQRIRDEAHRFVITRHRKTRKQRTLRSALTEIPGVGEKTARRLLISLGSEKKVREAPVETLQTLLGPARGLSLYEALHRGVRS